MLTEEPPLSSDELYRLRQHMDAELSSKGWHLVKRAVDELLAHRAAAITDAEVEALVYAKLCVEHVRDVRRLGQKPSAEASAMVARAVTVLTKLTERGR